MPPQPAAVVRPFPSEPQGTSPLAGLIVLLGLLVSLAAVAQVAGSDRELFVADLEFQSADEFRETLRRAEQLLVEGVVPQDGQASVTFVLHGPVIRNLLRENYRQNKELVDLAASLSALGVVDIKACRTWMGGNHVDESALQPFVETVPYGREEIRRLLTEDNYINF